MLEYKAPMRDIEFLVNDLLDYKSHYEALGFEDADPDTVQAILGEAAKFAEEVVGPLNQSGDQEGCKWEDGVVTTPKGFKEAYKQYCEAGWPSLPGAPELGGQGLPASLTMIITEMVGSANWSWSMYPGLSNAATRLLNATGSDEQKELYLKKLISGEWTGTMCLTESHAGSDLGLLRTKATENADGSYNITGTKIFISCGEHDMADNIVHLVLARIEGAPEGTSGISLFVAPKFLLDENGNPGERNSLECGSIEHKMGINASATCVMNFDGAEGYLVGEINRGLQGMFTMMNYERLSVGIQGLSAAQTAYQWSCEYARERLQSRAPTGPVNQAGPADPIVVHPDVRRMLLTQKALVEAGRAFAVYVGKQLDVSKFGDGDVKVLASGMVELLTPVAKAFLTDKGFEGTVLGQQCYGGHGYVREWGMEQLVRDVRIAQIYEGTNGIQAMDLMGRKVAANGAKNLQALIAEMRAFSADSASVEGMDEFLNPLNDAVDNLESLTKFVLEQAGSDANAIGAAANEYLHVMGFTLFSYMWAMMCRTVLSGESQQGEEFDKAKLQTARFFVQRLLPQASALSASIRNGSSTLMDIAEEAFA